MKMQRPDDEMLWFMWMFRLQQQKWPVFFFKQRAWLWWWQQRH